MVFNSLVVIVLAALAGTAPRPGRAGVPIGAAPDTIYALAVDSAKYPRESYVYLLDDGVLRYEADGRGSRTYRQVIQVLRDDAVEQWAEFSFGYEPSHERLTVNWVRVVGPDGNLISDKPGVSQDADVPAPMRDPTYVERKVRRLSLTNVRPGVLVDYSYTIEELKPFRAGDFYSGWRVNPPAPVRRSRLVLDTPASLAPRIVAHNLNFRPVIVEANGRRVTTWATREVPKIEPEPFAADSNGVDMSIDIGSPSTWREVGAWYSGLARDRYGMTDSLERKLKSLVTGAGTLDDSIKAIQTYVARDVRYVAISLHMGGYQPRSAAAVLATGYGDCKDKATLFITFMQRLGIKAYPVLLSAGGRVERELPTIAQFNHAIAAVERPGGRVFVDLTASDTPWGFLPGPDQGQFVLVVYPDGRTEETTTPEDDPASINVRVKIAGTLDTAGYAATRTEMAFGAGAGAAYHALFAKTPPDSLGRARLLRQMASSIYPGSDGENLELFDETEAGGSYRISFSARNGRAAQLAGPVAILSLPFVGQLNDPKPLIAQLEEHPPRRYPIDVAQVSANGGSETQVRLELPQGWRAELPKNVSLSGPFGEFGLSYAQEGRVLTVTERRVGAKGILPPERLNDLVAWLEQMAAATRESASIVIKRNQ